MQKLIVVVMLGFSVIGLVGEACAQATAKPQFIWNPQEREAVEVVKAWVNAWATKDAQRIAELMADNCVFRSDPSQPMQTGREAFIKLITPLLARYEGMTIEEVYVTGSEWETAVMIKRADKLSVNAGAARAGRAVPIASFFRVKNRRITEWLDAPTSDPG